MKTILKSFAKRQKNSVLKSFLTVFSATQVATVFILTEKIVTALLVLTTQKTRNIPLGLLLTMTALIKAGGELTLYLKQTKKMTNTLSL